MFRKLSFAILFTVVRRTAVSFICIAISYSTPSFGQATGAANEDQQSGKNESTVNSISAKIPGSIGEAIEWSRDYRRSPVVTQYLQNQGESSVVPLLNAYFSEEYGDPRLESVIIAMGPKWMLPALKDIQGGSSQRTRVTQLENARNAGSGGSLHLYSSPSQSIRLEVLCRKLIDEIEKSNEASDRKLYWTLNHGEGVQHLRFNPVGDGLVTATTENAYFWDKQENGFEVSRTIQRFGISGLTFSPKGDYLAIAHSGGVSILQYPSGKPSKEISYGSEEPKCVSFCNGSKQLAVASNEGWNFDFAKINSTIKIFDVASAENISTFRGNAWVTAIAAGGKSNAVLFDSGKSATLFDFGTGENLHLFKNGGDVRSVAASPLGDVALIGGDNASVVDLASGEMLHSLDMSGTSVTDVVFDSQGKLAATASTDKLARIWEVTTGKKIATLRGATAMCTSVSFSHNAELVALGSDDAKVRIWLVQE